MENKTYVPADIEIYIKGQGIVARDISLVAFDSQTNKILAMGREAQCLMEHLSQHQSVISPLKQGRIADVMASVALFRWLMEKTWGKKTLFRPSVVVCVSKEFTELERKIYEDVIRQSGAKQVWVTSDHANDIIKAMDAGQYGKYQMILVIGKEDVESYILEELTSLIHYAKQEHLSFERIEALLKMHLKDD